jgi:hypothetical protein
MSGGFTWWMRGDSKDPSRKVTAPLHLLSKDKTVLTWDQLRLALAWLTHSDLVM